MRRKILIPLIAAILIAIVFLVSIFYFYGPAGDKKQNEIFVVPQNIQNISTSQKLAERKFIKNEKAFDFLLNIFAKGKEVKSGGYYLSQNMNAWQILTKITGKQDLFWVTISFCPRKEQVGDKLANALGWNREKLNKWNSIYKNSKPEYYEGVYYPDTYLIPANESETQVTERFIRHFNEKFSPFVNKFAEKNIKWTTGLKVASLIAREAGGKDDMKLISGIIWNRLDKGMPLQIDATMQYTLGKDVNGSWWGNVSLEQKQSDSPYNSYLNKGLPPTPICSPNIEAIEAALNPEETVCLYYLHDTNKQIHCAKTYKEHLANIEKYLRN